MSATKTNYSEYKGTATTGPTCPICGEDIPLISCEKTTHCSACGRDWKYDENYNLIEVRDGDDIYLDR